MAPLNTIALFITPPSSFTAYTGTRINAAVQHYPILCYKYLSSYVKYHLSRRVFEGTRVLDMGIEKDPWLLLPRVLREVRPRIVAMTSTTPLFYEVRLIGMIAKAVLGPDVIVVHGGIHPSALPEESLEQTMCDAVVTDEGEITFKEICEGRPFDEITGIVWRRDNNRRVARDASAIIADILAGTPPFQINGIADDEQGKEIVVNLPRPLMKNAELDALPFADMDLYDERRYRNPRMISKGWPMMLMETSRGCPFHCSFCSADDAYRTMSPERVIAEMKEIKRRGYTEVRFVDDQFATNMKRAKRIFERMLEEGLHFHMNFGNGVRADRIDTELLMLGKRAGLYQVGIGFESGDQIALDSMHKGLKDGWNTGVRCMEMIRKVGIESVGFFMFGAAGDTEESLNRTIAYAKLLRPDYAKVTISMPFPDTRLFAEFERKGLIRHRRWDLYNIHQVTGVYEHPNGLSSELLKFYYNLFYREYYLLNWPFIWRRALKGIKDRTVFSDLWYGFRTFFPGISVGDPRTMGKYKPQFVWEDLKRKVYGKPESGQITWEEIANTKPKKAITMK